MKAGVEFGTHRHHSKDNKVLPRIAKQNRGGICEARELSGNEEMMDWQRVPTAPSGHMTRAVPGCVLCPGPGEESPPVTAKHWPPEVQSTLCMWPLGHLLCSQPCPGVCNRARHFRGVQ
jgi:hypothetical protein